MTRCGFAAVIALVAGLAAFAAEPAPEPAGYRGEPYKAPVPATLAGAIAVDDDAAHALWATGRVAFVDVLPRAARPDDLPEDTIWRDKPHDSVPGALWLPGTGYKELAPEELHYLLAGLGAASGGDMDAPLVFFCKSDCWMSWNAAKRAVEHGYTRAFWYPGGVDGWQASGAPLEPVEPWAVSP